MLFYYLFIYIWDRKKKVSLDVCFDMMFFNDASPFVT